MDARHSSDVAGHLNHPAAVESQTIGASDVDVKTGALDENSSTSCGWQLGSKPCFTAPERTLPERPGCDLTECPSVALVGVLVAAFLADRPRWAGAVRDFLSLRLGSLEHEVFAVLLLDASNRLIEFVEFVRGTIDGASVYPREVVKLALAKNAAAVLIAHDHPSGVTEPSHADELILLVPL